VSFTSLVESIACLHKHPPSLDSGPVGALLESPNDQKDPHLHL
jgi:hypothetical protein